MIYIDGTILDASLMIKETIGLKNAPKLKSKSVSFPQKDKSYFNSSDVSWQYDLKKIEFKCFITKATYAAAISTFNSIVSSTQFEGYKQLTIPNLTNNAYVGFFDSKKSIRPSNYKTNETTIEFKLTFYEVQPYNINLKFEYGGVLPFNLNVVITTTVVPINYSDNTAIVYLNANGVVTQSDIARTGGFTYAITGSVVDVNINIYGAIDKISAITVTENPVDIVVANLMLRNGSITKI